MVEPELRTSNEDFKKKVSNKILERITNIIFTRSQEILQKKWKTSTGELLRTAVPPHKDEEGNWVCGYTVPWALHVEHGTGVAVGNPRYMPPYDAIHKWVERSLRDGKLKLRKGDTVYQLTKRIRYKIWKEGIPPVRYMRTAVDETVRKYRR